MGNEMAVLVYNRDDTLIVKVTGPVDTNEAELLRNELYKIIKQKPHKVVMDLSLVPTMGSSGIGKILIFFKGLNSMGSHFEIKGIHKNLYGVFKAVKLDKLFSISLR
ncbi:MAG TPA: anti-sigma factor antagonist [Deltaproteobacteria bacterium]|nr:anti-sigma factor antagonist [Deltaproteobacteria bacterium]